MKMAAVVVRARPPFENNLESTIMKTREDTQRVDNSNRRLSLRDFDDGRFVIVFFLSFVRKSREYFLNQIMGYFVHTVTYPIIFCLV